MQGKNAGRAGRLIGLSALLAALLAAALLLWKPGGGEGPASPPGELGAVVPPAEEKTPQPAEPVAEAGRPVPAFVFQQAPLPQYFRDFLEDGWEADYRSVMEALYRGRSTVRLTSVSTEEEWEQLRRPVQLAFPPRALLYDAHYYQGEGPFSFDGGTGLLTIRYGWEQELPSVAGREEYLEAVEAFQRTVTGIFDACVTDLSDAEGTAGELYDYVSSTLSYELDMRLDLYDAFTRRIAYCQTYSQMYQYLMWQAGYECWLCGGGNYDHQWNVIWLDGQPYHVDTTWQSTGECRERYYFAMSDFFAESTGHGPSSEYMRADVLLDHSEALSCTDGKFDAFYRGAE